MIKNKKQFENIQEQASKISKAIEELEGKKDSLDVNLYELNRNALESQLKDLQDEMEFFTSIKSGELKIVRIGSVEDLHKVLIAYRIAIGLTQKDLAEKLGIKEQQIQRYEASDYQSASWHRILDVISALKIIIQIKDVIIPKTIFMLPTGYNRKTFSKKVIKYQQSKSMLQIAR